MGISTFNKHKMFNQIETVKTIGEISDGIHSFNELYYHRAVLFSIICNNFKNIAWKSKQHSDGTMFSKMFIVGINTELGQATYHFHLLECWDLFNIQEVEYAPEWDGHDSDEVLIRLQSLSH